EKSLLEPLKKSGGRNHHGRVPSRRRGGGATRMYRRADFQRDEHGVGGTAVHVEDDADRTPNSAPIPYDDAAERYILRPRHLKQGDRVIAGPGSDIRTGNCIPLGEVPLGTVVHNIELKPGKGGQIVRSAGAGAQVVAKEGDYVTLRMPSTEVRMVRKECYATIGQVGNSDHELRSIGKAGAMRWRGRRPKVRG